MHYPLEIWQTPPGQSVPLTWDAATQQLASLQNMPPGLTSLAFFDLAQQLSGRFPQTAFVAGHQTPQPSVWPYGPTMPEPKTAIWHLGLNANLLPELRRFTIEHANALGLHVNDPQTGEVCCADGTRLTGIPRPSLNKALPAGTRAWQTADDGAAVPDESGQQTYHAAAIGQTAQTDAKSQWLSLKTAAEQGSAEAQFQLAKCYQQGGAVPKNDLLTAKYFRSAAQQGHAEALYQLGRLFAAGQGVGKDRIAASALFVLADSKGYPALADWPIEPEDRLQINALADALQQPGNFLPTLEQRQQLIGQANKEKSQALLRGFSSAQSKPGQIEQATIPYQKIIFPAIVIALLLMVNFLMRAKGPDPIAYDQSVCAGPPLTTPEAMEAAISKGYGINRQYNCIDKQSFDEANAQAQQWQEAHEQHLSEERGQLDFRGASALAQARYGFETAVSIKTTETPLPDAPAHLFVRSDYQAPRRPWMPGFVSPSPKTGNRHPAILWLNDGDSNSLGQFWADPSGNAALVDAFKAAGVVLYFPTLRGGNGDKNSHKEFLYGEVDDVLAAWQLARLEYVDPKQIYLGGHGSGGTLALLVAEMNPNIKAVFALDPLAQADHYPEPLSGIRFSDFNAMELKLRSPIHWLTDIGQPSYLIASVGDGRISEAAKAICSAPHSPLLHCLTVAHAGHASILPVAASVIAEKIGVASQPVTDLTLDAKEFKQ